MDPHKELNEKIMEIFDPDLERREEFFERIRSLVTEKDSESEIYQRIFQVLCHLEFSPEESLEHWRRITALKQKLEGELVRPVAFRVAMLQYFLSDMGLYQNPYLVELFLYESSHYNIMTDELTGLYNHRFLREYLWKESKRSTRYKKAFSILILDIDDFRFVNDNYGPLAGDEVLKSLARIIEENIRVEDVVGRYSGDAFIIILPETEKTGAQDFSQRLRGLIKSQSIQIDQKPVPVTCSIGISTFSRDSQDPIEVLEMAEKALYRAKFQGKDRVEAYSTRLHEI